MDKSKSNINIKNFIINIKAKGFVALDHIFFIIL